MALFVCVCVCERERERERERDLFVISLVAVHIVDVFFIEFYQFIKVRLLS